MGTLTGKQVNRLAGYVLVFLAAAAFLKVTGHLFLLADDPEYTFRNDHVRAGLTWSGIVWAFTSASSFNWHPGKTDKAAAHFRQALRLRPDYAEAKSNLEAAIQMYRREAEWKSANFHQKIETAGKETG